MARLQRRRVHVSFFLEVILRRGLVSVRALACLALLLTPAAPARAQAPPPLRKIGELDIPLLGVAARLDPADPVVPKTIASGVRIVVEAGGSPLSAADVARLVGGPFSVEAELSGPGLPGTITLPRPEDPPPSDPLLLPIPGLPTAGDYLLSNARIVRNGTAVMDVSPAHVTVQVIDQVLVSSVQTRPLTLDEIRARGIVLDNDSYLAFEFTLGLSLQSNVVNFSFPVVFDQRGVAVPMPLLPPPPLPVQPPPGVPLPPLPTIVPVLLSVDGGGGGGNSPPVPLPPLPGGAPLRIPGVIVIPGSVGYLKQFFSAQLYVANGAPAGARLTLKQVSGRIQLPPGRDLVPGTEDDPLSLAMTANGPQPAVMPVAGVGPDGRPGTADDTDSFGPGEQGQAEFLARGELEGFHSIDFDIRATLEGLPTGDVRLKGKASGGVLVRNPYFDMTFSVPSVVRVGESFRLFVSVTNIGQALANDLHITIDQAAMSGVTLVSNPSPSIGTLRPGDSKELTFDFVSQRTGQVKATYLRLDTTNGSTGTLRFTLGITERGVPLSPDTLVLPAASDALPASIANAAMRVLGQAWSLANAPQGSLPRGVIRTSRTVATRKALAVAEAGLRINLGQTQADAVRDLAFDLWGGQPLDPGFDQLLRQTDAGQALAADIGAFLADPTIEGTPEQAGTGMAQAGGPLAYELETARVAVSGPDFISFAVASGLSPAPVEVSLSDETGRSSPEMPGVVMLPLAASGPGPLLGLVASPSGGRYALVLDGLGSGTMDISVTLPRGDGTFARGTITGASVTAGLASRLVLDPSQPDQLVLLQDTTGDGTFQTRLPLNVEVLSPLGPSLVSVRLIGPETLDGASPFGRQAAALFDRVVDATTAAETSRYQVPSNRVLSARRQLSGRLVFLSLEQPEGPYVPTTVSVEGVQDSRGVAGPPMTVPLESLVEDPGAVVSGRVVKADGTPAAGLSVVYSNQVDTRCLYPYQAGIAQTPLDGDGRYEFRFVRRDNCGAPFEVVTQDPVTGAQRKASASVRFAGERIVLDLSLLGRGFVVGTVRDEAGVPVPNARVRTVSVSDPQSGGLATTDGDGRYLIPDITVGAVNVTARAGTAVAYATGRIDRAGTTVNVDLTLVQGFVEVSGTVVKIEGPQTTPLEGVWVVYYWTSAERPDLGETPLAVVQSGAGGAYAFEPLPSGRFRIEAALNTRDRGQATGLGHPGDVVTDLTIPIIINVAAHGTVSGTVRYPDGTPAGGAVVTIAGSGVASGPDGAYTIPGVEARPYVSRTVRAQTTDGRRSGTNSFLLGTAGQVVTGVDVTLSGLGSASYTVLDAQGNPVPNQLVSQLCASHPCGCAGRTTDSNGVVVFDGVPVGQHGVKAVRSLTNPTYADVARGTASVTADGTTGYGVLRFAGAGTVTGTVLTPGSPPQPASGVAVTLHSSRFVYDPVQNLCDLMPGEAWAETPADGSFRFVGINAGLVRVSARQEPWYPTPAVASANLADGATADLDLTLVDTIAGVLSGTVFLPDGETTAGAGVQVTANGPLPDVTVMTDADGRYRFARIFPRGRYSLTLNDSVTGGLARETVYLEAGQDVRHDLRLKGRGTVRVRVVDAADRPVDSAFVRVRETEYPNRLYEGVIDPSTQGVAALEGVYEGPIAVEAADAFGRGARGASTLPRPGGVAVEVKLTLSATGSVKGHFVMPGEPRTPIPYGMVRLTVGGRVVGQVATAGSGDIGAFAFDYVPAGQLRLDGEDPLTGRTGVALGTITSPDQIVTLDVVAQALGTVSGTVTQNSAPEPRAKVTIASGSYRVTTYAGEDGRYQVPGVPEGTVTVTASKSDGSFTGQATGQLSGEGSLLTIDVALRSSGGLAGAVVNADGVTPAPVCLVELSTTAGYFTRATGYGTGAFSFAGVPAGPVSLRVSELDGIDKAAANATVPEGGTFTFPEPIRLNGVGGIRGQALDSEGSPTAASLRIQGSGAFPYTLSLNLGGDGQFTLPEVLAGPFTAQVQARSGSFTLWGNAAGMVQPGEILGEGSPFVIRLEGSGRVRGMVVQANGLPAPGTAVTLTLKPPLSGSFTLQAQPDGSFEFRGVPLGCFKLSLLHPAGAGRAVRDGDNLCLRTNGELLSLDTIILDNTPPVITPIDPAPGAERRPLGGLLVLDLTDVGSGIDPDSLRVSMPNGFWVPASAFSWAGSRASAPVGPEFAVVGANTWTLRVSDLAGNTATTTLTFVATGASVEGTITAADNTHPQGLDVRVDDRPPVQTDALGRYAAGGLRPGSHTIAVTDPTTGVVVRVNRSIEDGGQATVDLALPASASLRGLVSRRRGGGVPAPGITVTASTTGWPSRSAVTDPTTGRYDFGALPLGNYSLQATDAATGDRGVAPAELTTAGQSVAADIVLNGVGSVEVTVADHGGTPIPGADVVVTSSSPFAGSWTGRTAGDGAVSLANVLAGTITARTTVNGVQGEDSGPLLDGASLSLTARLEPAGTVSGTVFHAVGGVAAGVTVTISGTKHATTQTDELGQFEFEAVPYGSFALEATKLDTGDRGRFASVLSGSTPPASITLNGTGRVSVTVAYASGGGGAVPNAVVTLSSNSPFGGYYSGQTNEDGLVSFPHVLAGDLTATARASGLTGGATGTLLPGGNETLPVTLQETGTITGVVRDPNGPVGGVVVWANNFASAVSENDGRFTLPGLPLGSYTLSAYVGGRLRARETLPEELTVAGATQDLMLVGVGTVAGTVRDAAGALAAAASISLQSQTPTYGGVFTATSAGDGSYQITGVPIGPFLITASRTGQRVDRSSSVDYNGHPVPLDLQMLANALTLPLALSDGNALAWQIAASGSLASSPASLLLPTAGQLSLTRQGGGTFTFQGSGNTVASELGGRQVVLQQQGLAGLDVTRRVFIPNDGYFIRYLDRLENPGPSDLTVDIAIEVPVRISSYPDVSVVATSSGDPALTSDDLWFTVDDSPEPDYFDGGWHFAPLGVVVSGPGGTAPGLLTYASGVVRVQWTVVVPAGGSRSLLYALTAQGDRARAAASAERLATQPPELLAGLTPADAAAVFNFVVPGDLASSLEPLLNDGRITGWVFAGDGQTPISGAVVYGTFKSRSLYLSRPLSFTAASDGRYLLKPDLASTDSSKKLIPRAPFDLAFRYDQAAPAATVAPGEFASLGTIDLTSLRGRAATASSAVSCCLPENALDADLGTVWQTQSGDSASQGASPAIELALPGDVTVSAVKLRGRRDAYQSGAMQRAEVQVRDAAGAAVWSQQVELPLSPAYRDADVPIPGVLGRSVRVVGLRDAASQTSLAELQVVGEAMLGPTGRVDVDAVFAETGNLTGRVLRQDGTPVVGGSISLSDGTHAAARRTPDAYGAYSFAGVPAGVSYTLTATHPLGGHTVSVTNVSVVAGQTTTQDVVYPAFGEVRGTLYLESGSFASGSVSVSGPGFSRTTSVNAAQHAGRYVFPEIPSGTYTVTATEQRSSAAVTATLTVLAGPAAPTDFTFPPVGDLGVTVTLAGSPLASAPIYVQADARGTGFAYRGVTDVSGRLTVRHVPGSFTVRADHPQWPQAQASQTTAIPSEGAQVPVSLAVPELAAVSGVVRSRSGAVYSPAGPDNYSATVSARDASGQRVLGSSPVAADGSFSIANVPVGDIRLRSRTTEIYGGLYFFADTEVSGALTTSGLSLDALAAHGTLAAAGQRDLWAFDLAAGEPVDLFLVGTQDGAAPALSDPYLEIWGPDATRLVENDNETPQNPDARVTLTATQSGTHVAMARAAGAELGGYRFGTRNPAAVRPLRRYDASQVSGRVTWDDGRNAVGLRLRLAGSPIPGAAVTSEEGRYELSVFPAGVFNLQVVDNEDVVMAVEPGEVAVGQTATLNIVVPAHGSVIATVHRGSVALADFPITLSSNHSGALPGDATRVRQTGQDGSGATTSLPVGQVTARVVDPLTDLPYLLSRPLVAETPLTLDVQLPDAPTTIVGTVRLADQTPLPGATVEIPEIGIRISDATGAYRFDGVPGGSYTVTTRFNARTASQAVVASGTPLTADFTLALQAVKGRVTEAPSGAALAGGTVTVCRYDPQSQQFCVSTTTGADGRYLFVDLATGLGGQPSWYCYGSNYCWVSVRARSSDGWLETSSGLYFYRDRDEVSVLDLELPASGSVSGTVYRGQGDSREAVGGAAVTLTTIWGTRSRMAEDNGTYTFPHVRPGEAHVYAQDADGIPGVQTGTVVAGQDLPLDVTLVPVGTIAGVLVDPSNNPVEGAAVLIESPEAPRLAQAGRWSREATTAADGSFSVVAPAGAYRVSFIGVDDGTGSCQTINAAGADGVLAAGAYENVRLVQGTAAHLPQVLTGPLGSYGESRLGCYDEWAFEGGLVSTTVDGAEAYDLATPDANGRALRSLLVTGNGLRVREQRFVPTSGAYSRTLTLVTNPGPTPVTASVLLGLRLGDRSDQDIYWDLLATSSGDTELDTTDTWGVARHPDGAVDDVAIVVGDGSFAPETLGLDPGGCAEGGCWPGFVAGSYSLVVPPGETRALLSFSISRPAGGTAITDLARALAHLGDGDALAGLTHEERQAIRNFALPPGRLHVAVTDGGLPVDGAEVSVYDASGGLWASGRAEGGSILFSYLALGDYVVVARDPASGRPGRATVTVEDASAAVEVPLMAQAELGSATIHGTWGSSGNPVDGGVVLVRSPAFGLQVSVVLDEEGDATVLLPPGEATATWVAPFVGAGRIFTVALGATTSVPVRAFASGAVQGHVRAADGVTVLAGADVAILDVATGATLATTTTDGEGAYASSGLRPGLQGVRVRVTWPFDGSVHETTGGVGGFAFEGDTLTLDVTLSVITGVVSYEDGAPVPHPSVFATQADSSGNLVTYYAFASEADGSYRIIGAGVGTFSLTGQDPSSGLTAHASGTIEAPTTPVPLSVALPPSGTVSGTVSANGGAPFPDAAVGVASLAAFDRYQYGAGEGFQFERVPAGPLVVQAYAGGASQVSSREVLAPGGSTVVPLEMPATASVSGLASGVGGEPLPWAPVAVRSLASDGPFGPARLLEYSQADGSFSIPEAPVGPLRLSVTEGAQAGYLERVLGTGGLSGLEVRVGNALSFDVSLAGSDGFVYRVGCEGGLIGGSSADGSWSGGSGLSIEGSSAGCDDSAMPEDGGREISVGPFGVGTLSVTRKAYVPEGGGFARYLEIVSNPNPTSVSARVQIDASIGEARVVVGPLATSGTYTVIEPREGGACCAFGSVIAGTGSSVPAIPWGLRDAVVWFGFGWDVTVPAHGRVVLMHFAVLRSPGDTAGAASQAQLLASLGDASALAGMSAEEKAQVVNFNVP